MNFLYILITSFGSFITKVWGQGRRICSLILGVKAVRTTGVGGFYGKAPHKMRTFLSLEVFKRAGISQGEV